MTLTNAFCAFLFLERFVDSPSYTSANFQAEYGLARCVYAQTEGNEVTSDMTAYFTGLDKDEQHTLLSLYRDYVLAQLRLAELSLQWTNARIEEIGKNAKQHAY